MAKAPTADYLIARAQEVAAETGSRNRGGWWLAHQLHAHYSLTDAEELMQQYARSVPETSGKKSYTEREALSTLRSEWNKPKPQPWETAGDNPEPTRRPRSRASRLSDIKTRPVPPETAAETLRKWSEQQKQLAAFVGSPAESYLETRGIPSGLARLARVKYGPHWSFSDKWNGAPAVVFPMVDGVGMNRAANGRYLDKGMDPKAITYGAKILSVFATPGALDADPVAITEAPIDALSLALAGVPTLALCSTQGIPDWLITRLGRSMRPGYSRTVLLAFDADAAGDKASEAMRAAMPLVNCLRFRPPEVKDWNQLLTSAGVGEFCDAVDSLLWDLLQVTPERPDPRPDLTADSSLWIRLLHKAQGTALYAPLHHFRCEGARLESTGLKYDQDRAGFNDQSDFDQAYSELVEPHAVLFGDLLGQVSK